MILASGVRLLLVIALASCAPTVRLAGRCPGVVPQAVDFAAGTVALAASAVTYNEGRTAASLSFAVAGMSTYLASSVAGCR